jgi:hypothetical protein
MYRQIFTPSEQNNAVVMPREWYGMEVEVIAFPVVKDSGKAEADTASPRKRRLQEIRAITGDIRIDLSNFQFNRDEANCYD